jgi:hypothetical protein
MISFAFNMPSHSLHCFLSRFGVQAVSRVCAHCHASSCVDCSPIVGHGHVRFYHRVFAGETILMEVLVFFSFFFFLFLSSVVVHFADPSPVRQWGNDDHVRGPIATRCFCGVLETSTAHAVLFDGVQSCVVATVSEG